MRMYLPFNETKLNVACLSESDLTIQRNVAMTILETLGGKSKGWRWHPGVNMWIGYDVLLAKIAHAINVEWCGMNPEACSGSTGRGKVYDKQLNDMGYSSVVPTVTPWWWGNKEFHNRNKAAMLRSDPDWYGALFNGAKNDLCDWWPRHDPNTWVYGPQPGPDGVFYDGYIIEGKPVLKPAKKMTCEEFAEHANIFHNLMPDVKTPIQPDDPSMELMIAVHNRFHQVRFYGTHDHR